MQDDDVKAELKKQWNGLIAFKSAGKKQHNYTAEMDSSGKLVLTGGRFVEFFVNKDKTFDSLDANASAGDGGADAKSAGSFLDFQWASLKVKTKYQAKKSDFEKHFKQLQDLVGMAKVDIDVATWNVFSKDEQNKIYFLEYADYASCGCVCLFFA